MLRLEGDTPENKAEAGAEAQSKRLTGELKDFDISTYYKQALSTVNILESGQKILSGLYTEFTQLISLEQSFERLAYLDQESAKINKSLGLGSQKAGEFRQLIVEASSNYKELGLSLDDISKDYIALSNTFGSNISITDETMTELAATSLVTGQKTEDLAKSFRKVGVDVAGIAPRMMEVTKVAKESGAIVGQVAGLVTANIQKMNLYNFEGGVKGLAKMSAQASKLGIDMGKVFALTEKVFNPEGAIEVSAALQRLGVSTSSLLDPLSLMDMSANDPTELQNQIVNMTKDFVKFNKDLGEFQILPGEKRRLREIADALGMTSEELSSMALNASNLEYKMKQIKFSPDMSKEDREMIASMAQINKQGVAEVKVKQFVQNEKGEEVWTGEYEMVEASKLTPKQLTALKESQELQGATMEEIAIKQQGELEGLNNKVQSILTAVAYGAAGTQQFQSAYKMSTTGLKEVAFQDKAGDKGLISKEMREAETYRAYVGKTLEEGKKALDYVVDQVSAIKDLSSAWGAVKNMAGAASTYASNFSFESVKEGAEKVAAEVKLEKESMGSYKANTMGLALPSPSNATNTTNTNLNATNTTATNTNTNTTATLNNNINLNVKMDETSKNQALSTLVTDAVQKYLTDPTNIDGLMKAFGNVSTSNNTVLSNIVK